MEYVCDLIYMCVTVNKWTRSYNNTKNNLLTLMHFEFWNCTLSLLAANMIKYSLTLQNYTQ